MKKALLVTHVSGFVPQFEMNNVRILKEMGYEVHYASNFYHPSYGHDNSRLDGTGIICHQIDFERSPYDYRNFKAYRQLKQLMTEENFDLLHCHTPVGGVLARLAAHATHTGSVIYTAHGFHFFKGAPLFNWLLYYPVEWWLSRYTDVQITINDEDYLRTRKFHAKRVERIHGVGIDLDDAGETVREKKRKELNIESEKILVITAGELNKNKNQKMVIEAMKCLKGIVKQDIIYLVCGEGNCLEFLKRKAAEYGMEGQIRFLGYRNDLREILSAADIFLMPSYREGLPTVVMEAMNAKLPVIGTDIRGNRELIEHGKTGYLVKVNDAGKMAEYLTILAENEELRTQMGKKAKCKVCLFGKNQVEREMRELYSSLKGVQ